MLSKSNLSVFLAFGLAVNFAAAQQIDVSRAEIKQNGNDAIQIEGFTLQGDKPGASNDRYKARFRWAADKKAFFMEPLSLEKVQLPSGGECTLGNMISSGGNYTTAQYQVGKTVYGAVRAAGGGGGAPFSAAWFGGPLDMNPYLIGRDKKGLVEGKIYGVLGNVDRRLNGFWPGQIVEVNGDIKKSAVQIRSVESNATLAFKSPDGRIFKGSICKPNNFDRNDDDNNNWYTSNITGTDSGSLTPNRPGFAKFEVSWNQPWEKGQGTVWHGIVGPTQHPGIPGVQTGDRALITALGQFGYVVTSIGPDGVVKAAAVFITTVSY